MFKFRTPNRSRQNIHTSMDGPIKAKPKRSVFERNQLQKMRTPLSPIVKKPQPIVSPQVPKQIEKPIQQSKSRDDQKKVLPPKVLADTISSLPKDQRDRQKTANPELNQINRKQIQQLMTGAINDGLHEYQMSPLPRLTEKPNIAALLLASTNDFASRFDQNSPLTHYKTVSTRDVEKGPLSFNDITDDIISRGNNYGYQNPKLDSDDQSSDNISTKSPEAECRGDSINKENSVPTLFQSSWRDAEIEKNPKYAALSPDNIFDVSKLRRKKTGTQSILKNSTPKPIVQNKLLNSPVKGLVNISELDEDQRREAVAKLNTEVANFMSKKLLERSRTKNSASKQTTSTDVKSPRVDKGESFSFTTTDSSAVNSSIRGNVMSDTTSEISSKLGRSLLSRVRPNQSRLLGPSVILEEL